MNSPMTCDFAQIPAQTGALWGVVLADAMRPGHDGGEPGGDAWAWKPETLSSSTGWPDCVLAVSPGFSTISSTHHSISSCDATGHAHGDVAFAAPVSGAVPFSIAVGAAAGQEPEGTEYVR